MPRLATRIPGLGRLLRRGEGQPTPPPKTNQPAVDPLLAIGQRLREEREARGLNLRQLALDTRISTAVLEALEKGWRDRLPEPTYLRGMLTLLEQRLELSGGSLQVALPPRVSQAGASLVDVRQRRFSPTSIELFTTWQGCLLYGLLCLGLIYGLNRQQQQLASRGLFTLRPLPPLPAASDRSQGASDAALPQRLLAAYPDWPVLHYGETERLALVRLAQRQGASERQIAALRARLLDVHQRLRRHWWLPTNGYGLKAVAGWLGFRWRQKGVDGARALLWWRRWRLGVGAGGRGSRHNLRWIFRYNHDDSLATWAVAHWLLAGDAEEGSGEAGAAAR